MARSNVYEVRMQVCAWLIGNAPAELLAFKDYGEGGAVAIGPDGKKYIFTVQQLEQGKIAMGLDQTAKAIEPARLIAEPPAKHVEPEPEPPVKKKKSTRKAKSKK